MNKHSTPAPQPPASPDSTLTGGNPTNVVRLPLPFVSEEHEAAPGYVRPIPAQDLRAIFNPKPDTFAMLAKRNARAAIEADERRDQRVRAWQRRVTVLCIVLFYALLVIFSFQIGRGL